MPPSGLSHRAAITMLEAMRVGYLALNSNVIAGRFKTHEEAIKHQLLQIERELFLLRVDTTGNKVDFQDNK